MITGATSASTASHSRLLNVMVPTPSVVAVGCGWTLAAQRPLRRRRESCWKKISRTMQFRQKRHHEKLVSDRNETQAKSISYAKSKGSNALCNLSESGRR
jgi:hypothetical protein